MTHEQLIRQTSTIASTFNFKKDLVSLNQHKGLHTVHLCRSIRIKQTMWQMFQQLITSKHYRSWRWNSLLRNSFSIPSRDRQRQLRDLQIFMCLAEGHNQSFLSNFSIFCFFFCFCLIVCNENKMKKWLKKGITYHQQFRQML